MALPVALLLAVIAFHGYQVVVLEDDPQRGGAFAMFATIDIGATRKVLATAEDGSVVLDLPASLDAERRALLDRPTEEATTRFAEVVLDLTWDVEDGRATATADGPQVFDSVRVQVVGFDADGRTISRRVLTDLVVESGS
ncbi:hypothetical protein GCM10023339_77240 [Alloalcanivorax gelatiniphagus]